MGPRRDLNFSEFFFFISFLYTSIFIACCFRLKTYMAQQGCSTMWVGRQSRRVCFGAKPDKGFLDMKSRPYPEVVRGREWELTTRPSRGQLAAGEQRASWRQESRSWRLDRERRTAERGSQHQTPEQRNEAAWDRVQRKWVKMSLIPVALWNFR